MNAEIYKLREAIEDRDSSQQGGLNAILTQAGFTVLTHLNSVDEFYKPRPRIELKASVGAATGRRTVVNGQLLYDAFHFQLGIQAVTSPRNVPGLNDIHEEYIASVRAAMALIGGNESLADTINFPNVYIAERMIDVGQQDYLKEDDGIEYSTLAYDGIVCFRPTAFN